MDVSYIYQPPYNTKRKRRQTNTSPEYLQLIDKLSSSWLVTSCLSFIYLTRVRIRLNDVYDMKTVYEGWYLVTIVFYRIMLSSSGIGLKLTGCFVVAFLESD